MMLSTGHYQVLSALCREGPKSRTDLAHILGLSKATISGLVRDLISKHILCEQELVFGLGRPSILLAVRGDAAWFIGISLQDDPVILVLTDLHGTVHGRIEIPRLNDPGKSIAQLANAVNMLRGTLGNKRSKLSGIGIALPGVVSRTGHICFSCPTLKWQNVDIGTAMAEKTGLPTWVENDAKALILGEKFFGPLKGSPDFSMLFVSHGIGCAHIINGRLLWGNSGAAGEISHAPVMTEGRPPLPCRCGNKGCLETVASLWAISQAARKKDLPTKIQDLTTMATKGNSEALAILHRAGSAMGIATAQLIQMLDPSHVVVMLDAFLKNSVYGHTLLHEATSHTLHKNGKPTTVHFRDFDTNSFAKGAASLAVRYFIFGQDVA